LPISAVDCVQPALQHTRSQLFTHFRLGQWSRLALVGILAAEIHVGGCGFGNLGSGIPHTQHKVGDGIFRPSTLFSRSSPLDWLPHTAPRISEHIAQFVALIVVGIFVVMVLSFIFLYLNSLFRFILFDAVLQRECSIRAGWQKWRRAGGRFFLWQIVFQISVWIFFAVLVGVPLALSFAAGWATDIRHHIGRLIVGVIFGAALLLAFVVTAVVVQVMAKDFLVPIMALEGVDFADAWRRLLEVVRREQGRFAIYLLLKLVLSIAAGILFTIIAIVPALFVVLPGVAMVLAGKAAGLGWNVSTISLAIILGTMLVLLLIYLIALVSVPATVFFPAFALYFFAARYPNLNLLLNPDPAPIPHLPPVPQIPPPFEAPPVPPSPEPIG
jgi:hypothetical protein